MRMRDLLRNAQQIIKSPICQRLALAVFLGIIVIEAIILLPSYLRRESGLLAELEFELVVEMLVDLELLDIQALFQFAFCC